MKSQVEEAVASYWSQKLSLLQAKVADAGQKIEGILQLEEYYRAAPKDESLLRQTLGSFGTDALDMSVLSSTFRQTYEARTMQKSRHRRLKAVAKGLRELADTLRRSPPQCTFQALHSGAEHLLEEFEAHIAFSARAFALVRKAELEARGRYVTEEHDPFFKHFHWQQLHDEEIELCPPFVILAQVDGHMAEQLGDLLVLANSGRPLNAFLLRAAFGQDLEETGRAAALRRSADPSLLFLSLRSIYFVQGSPAEDQPLENLISHGLESPRPAFFSLLAGVNGKGPGKERALHALTSRAFPRVTYDPDQSPNFVRCLDLEGNPATDAPWVNLPLEYQDDQGNAQQMERAYTFADFAATEADFKKQFTPLTESTAEESVLPLEEYLAATPGQRKGNTPFVYGVNGEKRLQRLAPSPALIARCADQQHLWHTLQELAGIKNPYVDAARDRLKEQLTAEQSQALDALRKEMAEESRNREGEAVAAAMKNLALRLTGLADLSAGDLADNLATATPQGTGNAPPVESPAGGASVPPAAASTPANGSAQPAAVAQAAAPPSETPWIEPRLCTTCDECTTINKKIFAYGKDKKAYIKDAQGGPYKDIVLAAEKCASEAIHPGLPQNPAEKGLEKLIERAARFQ